MTRPTDSVHAADPRTSIQARWPDGRILEGPVGTTLEAFVRAAGRTRDQSQPRGIAPRERHPAGTTPAGQPRGIAPRERHPAGTTPAGQPASPRLDEAPVVAAVVDGELRELARQLARDADVAPVAMDTEDGMRIYRRGLTFLMVAAAMELFPEAEVEVDHSVYSGGYFCQVRQGRFNAEQLARLEARMREMVTADLPIKKEAMPLADAIEMFRARGDHDKVRLLTQRRKDYLVVYRLGRLTDYFQGYMVPATGYLRWFGLHLAPPGFILQFPQRHAPTAIQPPQEYDRLLDTYREYGEWLDRLGIGDVGSLNEAVEAGRIYEVILVAEALHEQRLARIASWIAEGRGDIGLVLIAGPSSSGKTTFSKRLAVQLLANGLRPFALAMDEYFLDRELTPRDGRGEYDFESLRALNLERFNADLLALMEGREVVLPHYDFKTGVSQEGETVRLPPDSVIIVEGIHGLNPDLVPHIPPERVFRIYASALTQLNLDRHNRVSTTDTRLLRRIVRDAATRGYSAADTLRRWESVRRGEGQHIFPFQECSDVMFNSALIYELSVLRPLAEPLLLQVQPETPEHVEAKRLLALLKWFQPCDAQAVPDNSILREFVGGSILERFHVWEAGWPAPE